MRFLILLCLLTQPLLADEADVSTHLAPRPVVSELVSLQAGNQVNFVGVVVAHAETDLGFLLNGTIVERPVKIGDLVEKGDTLAKLDPEDLESDMRAAQAGVTVTTAQLRSARDAEARARELSTRGVDSATRLEDAQRALTSAEARHEQALAALARAEDMRSFATLSAPQRGVVTQIFVESGTSLTAGQPVLRLAGTQAREIAIDVAEQDAAGLNIGTVFDATLAANTDVLAQASLTRIDLVAARATRTRRVYLTLSDAPVEFRLGALVRVSLAASAEIGVSVDRSTILEATSSPAVWVIDRATNTVHLTPVTLGETFGSRVRITDGLKAGDEVVAKGINSLKDGQTVGLRVSQ